ncbi:PREDICTED: multidrug resistance-associated protein 4-like [Ceratosolen solmsi marchali]|uniref:Multidrug resistance-associated protein 4-like n=1 Tax=Ceratosolen solmsi marchali TaxID=326594 RepID=A0AAJ6YLF5_9HYME|nr:PREDICTED: multidrug resistance-associated protein 4-like [Ceratosolen solmsi marchali]
MAKIEAYGWAAGLAAGVFIDCITCHICVQNLMHTGMKIRVACSSLLYRKILNVPITFTDNETSAGQVLNLLSNDVSRIDHAVFYIHYIWMAPLQAFMVFYFLYREVGFAASSGIALQLLFIPVLGLFGSLTNRLTSKYTARTDERLGLTNEIIKGIRAIKMYAWEKPFSVLIDHARKKEMQIVKQDSIMTDISLASEFYIPRLCIFITILSFILFGNIISAEKVYVVTALYDVLRMSMYTLFPMCLHDAAEALVSVERLQKFMLIEEVPCSLPTNCNSPEQNESNPSTESIITLRNLSGQWAPRVKVLENVSLTIRAKSLTAVVGQVGAGKTSFLHAILRELPYTSGELTVGGLVSYASQEPWIFASTVRQNILFGRPLDKMRYENVIDVCQLRRDLDIFPDGDATMVGEKGINLSGGQCARLNLARAIYRDTDIYLLDDPLSAVDAVVGRKIFDECIKTNLKGKTVILVTHQFQYLEEVDRIIVLNRGSVEGTGTFGELQSAGVNLVQVMQIENEFDEGETPKKDDEAKSLRNEIIIESIAKKKESVVESKAGGSISAKTYVSYFSSSESLPLVIIVAFVSILHQLAASCGDYFLAYWVNAEENATSQRNETCDESVCAHRERYIYFYGGITIATITLCLLQSWTFFEMTMRIANNLHARMFTSVIYATIDFFSTNPLGRIMNRFSKDMSIVDTEVSRAMIDVIQNAIHIIAAFSLVTSVNPWLIIPTVLVGFFFYFFSAFFIRTSRSIKRLEGITRSPVFGHVSDTLQGLATIRALNAKETLVDEFDDHQNLHSSACFIFFSGSRGLGMYLDLFCALFLTCVLFTLMTFDETTLAGDIGLAITQCMLLINTLQWGVRQFAELENQMTSVERVLEYFQLPRECCNADSSDDKRSAELSDVSGTAFLLTNGIDNGFCPTEGQIEFRNVYLRYDKQGPAILKNLNFVIQPGEKVGIVGRTGAGKSSLINSLFRLAYIEGDIYIDQVLTNTLGLHELRSQISIIPQEPILFMGTVRKNLDPFDEYTDKDLWQALDDVGMKRSLHMGLDAKVAVGGSNFSVGQRQLLCLARAIVRKKKILVMDEATANVDPSTDDLIQKTVKKKFEACTILTIAHRLHTVIDSDRILVMDSGSISEFDHPYILLTNNKGTLYDIVQQSGSKSAQFLFQIAKLSFERKVRKN